MRLKSFIKNKINAKSGLVLACIVAFCGLSFSWGDRDVDKIFGRNHNVCRKLQGDVLVYVVWIEMKSTSKWLDYDLNSTYDSVRVAIKWLNDMAKKNNKALNIKLNTGQNDTLSTVTAKFTENIPDLINSDEGLLKIDDLTNKIVRTQSGERTKEQLISKLRNEYRVDGIALLFMVNNFYKEDYILSFNTTSNERAEYSILSTKQPTLIAQNLLNMFGAPYLYHHPATANKRDTRELQRIFHNDVMANTDRAIQNMEIGEVTRYFIGWCDTISEEYEKLVKEKPKI